MIWNSLEPAESALDSPLCHGLRLATQGMFTSHVSVSTRQGKELCFCNQVVNLTKNPLTVNDKLHWRPYKCFIQRGSAIGLRQSSLTCYAIPGVISAGQNPLRDDVIQVRETTVTRLEMNVAEPPTSKTQLTSDARCVCVLEF